VTLDEKEKLANEAYIKLCEALANVILAKRRMREAGVPNTLVTAVELLQFALTQVRARLLDYIGTPVV
jgi:hypothetical protein